MACNYFLNPLDPAPIPPEDADLCGACGAALLGCEDECPECGAEFGFDEDDDEDDSSPDSSECEECDDSSPDSSDDPFDDSDEEDLDSADDWDDAEVEDE